MHDDLHILRLGYYNHTNLLPLLYPIEAGWVSLESPWRVEAENAPPGALLERLLAGELDAALVAPGALAQHGSRLSPLGGWGLAVEGRAETAVLLAPKRLDMMDKGEVSIAPEAVGSTAEHLIRMLVEPYYGIELTLRMPDDTAHNMKGPRLLYGDDAAQQAAGRPKEWVAEDLGVAGYVFTGLPLVWEILAVERGLEERKAGASEQLQDLLRLSQRSAREQQATVLEVATQRLGLPQAQVKELFNRQRYTLGDPEQKGLARFLDLATRAKVLPG
jgi:predicted solute-binding protein